MSTELACAELRERPFAHVIVEQLFRSEFAAALLEWFEHGAVWVEQASHFYVQHACANLRIGQAEVVDQLLDHGTLVAIQACFEGLFGGEFLGSHVSISAHRLLSGEGIGIHTDTPANGTETHRLVVHCNRAFEDAYGGHLFLFGGPAADDLEAIVRPHHNSAVGFELSERSWHAVNDVSGGVRFSLIFGLWQVGAACEHEAGAHGHHSQEEPILDLLCQLRAHEVPHSGRTLMDHLLGTGRVLRRWGCDSSVCLAGMAHSLYGTPGFARALLDEGGRSRVRAAIGERAERLVWLFGHVDRRGLEQALRGDAAASLIDHRSGAPLSVSAGDLRDLAALSWANTLEQDVALVSRGEPPAADPHELARALVETSDVLPEPVVAELRSFYV